jgi:hypothetical protein
VKNKYDLLKELDCSRKSYLETIEPLSQNQAEQIISEKSWSVIKITEHLYWAEFLGIAVMEKELIEVRNGKQNISHPKFSIESTIEEIITGTWKTKEEAPRIAVPKIEGSIFFWKESFNQLQIFSKNFVNQINNDELDLYAHQHPISGPLTFRQRVEFLRFHIDRHKLQAKKNIKEIILE